MVDVSHKDVTVREAIAAASVRMSKSARARLEAGDVPKGDVWATARIAGIQAAKRTSELIPLCHAIALATVEITFDVDPDGERVHVRARVKARDRTGVEMEALTGATIAALTLYDMLKAIDRAIVIEQVVLLEKHGGVRGDWAR
ncbi:MAG: cyclic pyranopterin monophosphate synthase MoaC [Myxococcota bacterium]|nr:cyclic pyranopterin monophosphate synthase MoaC [Myxococcota bacterium]